NSENKMAAPKTLPKDAQVMMQILKDMGITEYEPRVINQMLEFTYRYVTTIIEDAKIYSTHAKKSTVDADDVRLAIQCRMDQSFTSPPPRDFLLEVARQKNQTPLPLIKPYTGPRLPPDRYCLTAPNYRLKTVPKKSRFNPGSPSGSSVPSVSKVSAPVSLAAQRFTVQIPSAQSHAPKTSKPPTATPPVLMSSSLIGQKTLLMSSSSLSQSESLKRKHDDEDDYDAI
uniref:Uncharacterized protein n=1 Tax=Periophthalmus magnuspinnatus TaxID=409849 RepID=A0A3B4BA51_9GOBI